MKKGKYLMSLVVLAVFLGSFLIGPRGTAEELKEYRAGQFASIGGKDYLIASNSQFVEILEVMPNGKLFQVSELHGMEAVNDLYVSAERGKTYLIVATGQYLIKYDITNPILPTVNIKRDLYEWHKGQYKIGYMKALAGNNEYFFAAGSRGVRRFIKENLFVDKIYTFEKSYGVAVGGNKLAVLTEEDGGLNYKGLIFDIKSGNLLEEIPVKNTEGISRCPAIDAFGNVYFPSDNNLLKIKNGVIGNYVNPTPDGSTFSYGASALPGGQAFYVNGYGITKLNKNFSKEKFASTGRNDLYGYNSWAVGVAAGKANGQNMVAVFDKASIILFDENLNLTDQYKYTPKHIDSLTTSTELKMEASKTFGMPGQTVYLKLYGFWPNERVIITLEGAKSFTSVNNLGYGEDSITVPSVGLGTKNTAISAKGEDSGLNYQVGFRIN